MDSGLRPVVNSVNAIRVPQDYVTQSGPLREMNGSLGVLAQQLQNAKLQADAAHSALKQSDDLKPVFDQAFTKVVTTPADALQPLIPAAPNFHATTGDGWRLHCSARYSGELCRKWHPVPDFTAGK